MEYYSQQNIQDKIDLEITIFNQTINSAKGNKLAFDQDNEMLRDFKNMGIQRFDEWLDEQVSHMGCKFFEHVVLSNKIDFDNGLKRCPCIETAHNIFEKRLIVNDGQKCYCGYEHIFNKYKLNILTKEAAISELNRGGIVNKFIIQFFKNLKIKAKNVSLAGDVDASTTIIGETVKPKELNPILKIMIALLIDSLILPLLPYIIKAGKLIFYRFFKF
jgi:hypothetical protein